MKFAYRFVIDGIVIVMAAFLVWSFATDYFFTPSHDLTIPDEVHALDREVEAFMQTARGDFQEQYANPVPLDAYEFVTLSERTALADPENYRQSVESIVYISTLDALGWWYIGSGSILTSDGVILTNHHVIDEAETVVVATANGDLYEVAAVLAYDEALDIAFIKIDAADLVPLPIGDSSAVRIGEKSLVIGHSESLLNSLSLGNVSGIRGYHSQGAGTQFQITNPISLGNSGGAVLNEYGEIIGVPSWSLEYEDNSIAVQNINFAVPVHEALAVLER